METTARPRFRQDLVAELVEEQGQRFIDVGDPDTGSLFRFYEVEYSLACAMDGERDVAGIVKWAQEELGLTPSPKEVQTVISTLVDLRFIDAGDVAADGKIAKAAPTQPTQPTQPTPKAAKPDGELARGVVVGATPSTPASSIDVELGHAGSKAPTPAAELPAAPDLALGAPGAAAAPSLPRSPVEDIALGAPGRTEAKKPAQSEVSLDLSAHVDVRPDDVKEAVRQSKVMSAVDVPKELLEAEAPKAAPKAADKAPAKAEPARAEKAPAKQPAKQPDKQAEAKAAAKQPETKAPKAAEKAPDKVAAKADAKQPAKANKDAKPAAKDAKPAAETKRPATDRPTAPPAPRAGVSPVLVAILILAVVGAGVFFAYKFLIKKTDDQTSQVKPPPAPPAPPPPVEVISKVALETPTPQDIAVPAAGTLEAIETEGKDVKTGDVIGRLAGGKPLETEIANLERDVARLQPAVDTAQQALADAQQVENNQTGVDAAQAKLDKAKKPLDDKKAALEKKQAELDKLAIKATADGTLAEVATLGQKVAADEVVAKVARETMHVATFKIPAGTKIAPDGTLSVTAGDKTIVCTVIDAQVDSVKVKCPGEDLAEGAELKLKLPR